MAVRQAPDMVLHQMRRYAAQVVISRPRRLSSVLVVCHGDVCRSPFAAVIIGRWLARAAIPVQSAGFVGPGRRSPPTAIAAANRRGVNLSTHRSSTLTAAMVGSAGLIVTMDVAQARQIRRRFGKPSSQVLVLGDFDPVEAAPAIDDPFGQPAATYDHVFARVERCSAAFTERLFRRL
ncbi:MAG: low molecular weight phosphatase family protein [Gemmatimonadaceae bacterium]